MLGQVIHLRFPEIYNWHDLLASLVELVHSLVGGVHFVLPGVKVLEFTVPPEGIKGKVIEKGNDFFFALAKATEDSNPLLEFFPAHAIVQVREPGKEFFVAHQVLETGMLLNDVSVWNGNLLVRIWISLSPDISGNWHDVLLGELVGIWGNHDGLVGGLLHILPEIQVLESVVTTISTWSMVVNVLVLQS